MIAAAFAAIIAADFSTAQAQNDDETAGRIVARLLDDGRVEFGWQPSGGERVLPRQRYFPADATVDRWLRSSPVEVDGAEIGRINAWLLDDGRIEFAFTPTDGERITPQARYFPAGARVGRWLRSTEITLSPPVVGYIAVSAGYYHTCAIRAGSGAIDCWGSNGYTTWDRETEKESYIEIGQTDAPGGSFIAVSAGDTYTCAIRDTGVIECWGLNNRGQGNAPGGRYTAISAAKAHTCAIRAGSGAIDCWGSNFYGETDAPDGSYTAISARFEHTCAIRAGSGAIDCWGSNGYTTWDRETEKESYIEIGQTDAPEGSFTAVSAGSYHTCALRADSDEIECWGSNAGGQSDAPAGNFTAISLGSAQNCAIRESGAIECWGSNTIGKNDTPEGSFITVSAGGGHTCAIRTSGKIACWGHNEDGQATPPAN